MIFILQFANVMYHIDLFVDVESSLLPWNIFHLTMMCDPFNVCLILFASILLKIFALTFIKDIRL